MCVDTFPSEVGLKGIIRTCIPINLYPQAERTVEDLFFLFIKSSKHSFLLLIEVLKYKHFIKSH